MSARSIATAASAASRPMTVASRSETSSTRYCQTAARTPMALLPRSTGCHRPGGARVLDDALGNRRVADDVGDEVGLAGRERAQRSEGSPAKGSRSPLISGARSPRCSQAHSAMSGWKSIATSARETSRVPLADRVARRGGVGAARQLACRVDDRCEVVDVALEPRWAPTSCSRVTPSDDRLAYPRRELCERDLDAIGKHREPPRPVEGHRDASSKTTQAMAIASDRQPMIAPTARTPPRAPPRARRQEPGRDRGRPSQGAARELSRTSAPPRR